MQFYIKTAERGDISNSASSLFYSVDWANGKLRFAIGTLQGKYENSIWKIRLQTALICKEELIEHHYFWQAQIIDFWIHRLQNEELAKDKERFTAHSADLKRETEEGSFLWR